MGVILRYKDFLETYKTRSHRIRHLKNYEFLFPIKASPKLAGIVGDMIGDGSLQGAPIWRGDFTSKSKSELKRFETEIYSLFGKKCRMRKCTSNTYGETYNMGINCSPVARILFLCGVPAGQKVLKRFGIPDWIKEDKECFRRFCQRFFSCEGGIMCERSRKSPQIRLDYWKSESLMGNCRKFIGDICKYMKRYFGINYTITFPINRNKRKDGIITRPVRVYILNKSVKKFYEEVGFEGDKQQSLKALLSR